MTRPHRILIVAYDPQAELVRSTLEKRQFYVASASDYKDAYRRLIESEFDLVIIDLDETPAGVEFVKRVHSTTQLSRTLLLVLVEWGTGIATLALAQGADAYEPKPIDAARVLASVERLVLNKIALAQGVE